jgi:hypothetical protein
MSPVGEVDFCHGGIRVFGHGYHIGNGWATAENGNTAIPDVILLQFTGLRDSNGDELIEKDVVYLAGYGNYVCEFPFITLYEAAAEGDIGEKLGNVLENPELGL